MSNWAVLCPGPSLRQVNFIAADPGCVIAVNSAILHKPEITRFWAVMDGEVFETVASKINLQTLIDQYVTLWTHYNFESAGKAADWNHEIFELYRAFPILSWKKLEDVLHCGKLIPFWSQIPWQNYTFFTALALAIICRAENIHVYGADLGGDGYFCDGFKNFRTDHREPRWKTEREGLQKIIEYCHKNNLSKIYIEQGRQSCNIKS